MSDDTERQFQAADDAIGQAVFGFARGIAPMFGQWEAVPPEYIIKRLLLALSLVMVNLIDDPRLAGNPGPEALKLSNALADYQDSLAWHR
jgi:hypothetical protein